MKAIVDADACTGCGTCEDTCPEVFEVVDDLAKVKENPVAPEHEQTCREAAEECPADAIRLED